MSSIDLSNPKVLRNYLLTQMQEGKGKLLYREKVLIFKDNAGNEVVAPAEFVQDLEVLDIDTNEILIESPEPEKSVDEDGKIKKPKKKKKVYLKK